MRGPGGSGAVSRVIGSRHSGECRHLGGAAKPRLRIGLPGTLRPANFRSPAPRAAPSGAAGRVASHTMPQDSPPFRRVTTAVLVLLAAATAACAGDGATAVWGRGEAVGQLVQERATRADSGTRLDLADLAPFRWEAVHVLAPGTPADSVRARIGAPLPGDDRLGAAVADSLTLLVFTSGPDVLAATLIPRGRIDVEPAATGRRYGPTEARFRVEGVGEGRWRLVLAP